MTPAAQGSRRLTPNDVAKPSSARAALVLSSCATLLGARPLRAETESVTARLEWRQEPAAEACLDGDALKRAVNRRWGRSVFAESASPDIVLRGTIGHAEPKGWAVSLTLSRADGTSLGSRELVTAAPSCSSLDDSVALAVGLMLDVSRQRIAEERRAAAEPTTKAQPAPLDGPPIAIPKETLPSRDPWRVEPSIALETAVGLLPGWGLAPRAGIAIVPPRFVRVEAAVSLFLPDEETAGAGRGARFSGHTAELAVCPVSLHTESLRADACLTERVGAVRAAGFGFTESSTATELVAAIGAREVATLTLVRPLALFLGLGVEAPFLRYRFVFGDSAGGARVLHRMAPIVGTGALGLSLEW